MKNYQQTPKQRRVSIAKAKASLSQSKKPKQEVLFKDRYELLARKQPFFYHFSPYWF